MKAQVAHAFGFRYADEWIQTARVPAGRPARFVTAKPCADIESEPLTEIDADGK
jgi:hypothetical protein